MKNERYSSNLILIWRSQDTCHESYNYIWFFLLCVHVFFNKKMKCVEWWNVWNENVESKYVTKKTLYVLIIRVEKMWNDKMCENTERKLLMKKHYKCLLNDLRKWNVWNDEICITKISDEKTLQVLNISYNYIYIFVCLCVCCIFVLHFFFHGLVICFNN